MAFSLDRYSVDLLTRGAEALEAVGRPVHRAHLVPGNSEAWDNCCEDGGQLFLRVVSLHPSTGPGGRGFPSLDARQACGIYEVAATLALGIVRCAHTVDDYGNPPTPDNLTADALVGIYDAEVLLDLIATSADHPCAQQVSVERWTPKGVRGGCAGGEWLFAVALSVFDREAGSEFVQFVDPDEGDGDAGAPDG